MRRAVLDSDDEGDDEVFISASSNNENQKPASNPGSNNSRNGEGTINSAIVKNTNSTELLRQQMLSAERQLVSNSAPMAASKALQSSPSLRAQKRRNTTAFGSGAATSPAKGVKRLKSLTTYSATSSGRVADESTFDKLRDDVDWYAPKTSQSARFTEHSGHHSSGELPAGSLGEDFADHEPAVMFRGTGSTVPDDSSAERRMLQQARSSKTAMSTSAVNQLQGEEEKSSSFPWSASEQTQIRYAQTANQSIGSLQDDDNASNDATDVKIANGVDEDATRANNDTGGDYAAHVNSNEVGDCHEPATDNSLKTIIPNQDAEITINDIEETIEVRSASKPQASPTVEISQSAIKTSRRDSTSGQKSTKARKRQSDEANDSEPLNSDDRAIGLPKERYQPRPSRRRSTQIADESVDYSVRPEKAAKAKRTKTSIVPTDDNLEISKEHLANLNADVEKAANKRSHEQNQTPNANDEMSVAEMTNNDVPKNSEEVTEETGSQAAEKTPSSSDKQNDDHIFKKPPKPTPKPKPASQSRRSRTTLFVDHVDSVSSQKSPTLSQQQAARKSARKDIDAEGAEPKKRKRKTVVEDDDDDEDELAKDSEGDQEAEKGEAAPTKRGRGRPAKAKPQAKSAEKVLEDSEDEGKDDEGDEDEAPKKKARGRPPKAAVASKPAALETEDSANASKASDSLPPAQENEAHKSTEGEAEKDQNSNADDRVMGKENLTPSPSPENPPEKPATTPPKEAKTRPTLRSPIKNSSAVPLRVGLNSTRRIPSLLKTFKTPRPRT